MILRVVYAFLISGIIVGLAWRRRALSRSGAIAALMVGTLILGLGGWQWAVLLGIFFVSSSLLSRFKETEKQAAADKFDKGHQRDWGQVAANGGMGALIVIFGVVFPAAVWVPLFVGVMATVTADTWATELGTLSRKPPRLITNGRLVETGTSGGVSWLGTTVSLLGGLLIGLAAGWTMDGYTLGETAVLGAVGGLAGSLFDSLLGATVQRIYFCDACQKDTERQIHKCGQTTRPLRGWPWLNNDVVNLLASLVGGLVSASIWLL